MKTDFIKLVATMREAQQDYEESHARELDAARKKAETKVDEWLLEYMAERIQIEMWSRGESKPGSSVSFRHMTDEESGAYNVTDESEKARESDA